MNLAKKKQLAAKTLEVGKGRITLDTERLNEIKEAITKQDIKDLAKAGAIKIKPIKGRKKIKKRRTKKRGGKIKKITKKRKREYVKTTRKLRTYITELKKQNRINKEKYKELRRKIKARDFKSKAQLKEYLQNE